jgi:hypothetical protein
MSSPLKEYKTHLFMFDYGVLFLYNAMKKTFFLISKRKFGPFYSDRRIQGFENNPVVQERNY